MRKNGICILICTLLVFNSCIVLADWSPGDGHKMHFPQLPDPNGWDVDWGLVFLGDDWICIETGYVKDIHFWISWWNDEVQTIPWINVSIWSNNPEGPHGWSIPDQILWAETFESEEFIVAGPWDGNQGWLNPPSRYIPDNHQNYYQINIPKINNPFFQYKDDIYWLVIKMPFDKQWVCGWKTTLDNYLDHAVFASEPITDWWLIDGIDLAFVIDGEPPKPNLYCEGDFRWYEVSPGDTLKEEFEIENIGEPNSLLSWYVDKWPSWGSWEFSPNSGAGLPDGNSINISVTITAPDENDQNYSGFIKIVNADNTSDYCRISVYLETPRSRYSYNQLLMRFLYRLFQRFQILQWLI
jgi:hypothetical protein